MEFLKRLTQAPAIAGRESRMRELILAETEGLFDEVKKDAMGSLICVRRPRGGGGGGKKKGANGSRPKRVMLAAHMDQIGFMVRYVEPTGFIRVSAVGGFDTRNLFARLATVCTETGDIVGVMNPGGKPVHIASEEDKKKIPEIGDLVIDLGLPAEQVKKKVQIGDMVVLSAPFTQVGKTVVSQCLDNRVACWIAIRAIQKLAKHACEIYCVFTVQEEVGLRGAMTSAYDVRPDVGVAIDTTLAVDTPGVPEDQRVTKLGDGAALTFMDGATVSDYDLVLELQAVAKKQKIKHQRSVLPRGGTDAGAIQRAARGARATTLSCPTRYIHTVTEMVHLDDLHACRDLLAAYLGQVK